MIKYKINPGWPKAEIDLVRVEKETAKCVYVIRSFGALYREAKVSEYQEYHDSWQSAHDRLTEIAARKLEQARIRMEGAQQLVDAVSKMKSEAGDRA